MLYDFGLFLLVVLAPKVFRPDVPFAPSWWAISFPWRRSVGAALRQAATHEAICLSAIAAVVLLGLTVAVLVLAVRTARLVLNGRLLSA